MDNTGPDCSRISYKEPAIGWRIGIYTLLIALQLLFFRNQSACQAGANPENLKFIRVTEQIGLKNRVFLDLYQDSYGFIWFGTDYGVFRFDGYECKPYYTIPGDTTSISSNGVSLRAFQEDANRDLWVATWQGGLNKFSRSQEKFERIGPSMKIPPSLLPSYIAAILKDGNEGLWIASQDNGLVHFDPSQPPYFKSGFPVGAAIATILASVTTVSLFQDDLGRLWVGTVDGLVILDPRTGHTAHFQAALAPDSLSGNFVTDIYQDKNGCIWVATATGLNLWEEATRTFVQYFPAGRLGVGDPHFNYIWKTFEDSQGNFWIGTNAGLLRFNVANGKFERFDYSPVDPSSISKGAVHAIMEDRSGNVWFGTETGVSILNLSARLFNREEVLPIQSSHAQITSNHGIMGLLEIKGRFWLATKKGLFVYEAGQALKQVLPGDFFALFKDSQDRVYAGTVGNGFYIMDARNLNIISYYAMERQNPHHPGKMTGHRVFDFAEDQQGHIWIATNGCLNYFDPSTESFRHYYPNDTISNGLANSDIKTLTLDSKGNLWISTQDGLNQLPQAELAKPFGAFRNFICYKHETNNANLIGVELVCETEPAQYLMDYDADKLRKIISNLLSNAIKFTSEKGRVSLHVRETLLQGKPQLQITISDTGIGIPEDQLDQVFEPFRQVDNKLTRQGIGSGIGLTLAKELVTLLEGTITVKSEIGKGTDFVVSLPVQRQGERVESINKDAFKQRTAMTGELPAGAAQPINPPPLPKGKPLLLIIEDNPNVRAFLVQSLKQEYQVYTAEDGLAGLELAVERTPDIIISDVMMPGKDGYEVCRELRKTPSTSHIPILLLTARAEVESKIQGLQAGADEFLAKPVNQKELMVRLKSLLALRQILQDRYRSPDHWKSSPPPRVSAEDEFLRKIQDVIEENISDPQLDIQKLERKTAMGKSQIHRKLKALTGMHTTEFVRYVRLTRASRLLGERPQSTISEIAFELGFSSLGYFSKKFKEVFGCGPKEWREGRGS